MKTVLFFDRCDLTELYVLLERELTDDYCTIHVAFSMEEIKRLKRYGIHNFIDYQGEISKVVDTLILTDDLLQEIDNVIIRQSKGHFNLNASIQCDRGYSILSYHEALRIAASHYLVWKSIFSKYKIDILLHEPASLFMTHIASLLCKYQGGEYIYLTQATSDDSNYKFLIVDGENFRCKEVEERYIFYKEHPESIDRGKCTSFLSCFRNNYSVLFSDLNHPYTPKWKIRLNILKSKILRLKNASKFDRVKNNIDYWILNSRNDSDKLYNVHQYAKRGVTFQKALPFGEKYYYYSIHMEPEATVLYLSDGIYVNQIKLIENIAAALPPHCYLYVKDHPHAYAYRKADDYERLMKVPNIRLIDQSISGKKLINGAIGVFSINGTAGFEGLMLGKQVYCFGKCYYTPCSRVNYIHNVRDIREVVYKNINSEYQDDNNLYAYVCAYLSSLHLGFVGYFGGSQDKVGLDPYENAKHIADCIRKFLN